mgnify:CR=1 FL=1
MQRRALLAATLAAPAFPRALRAQETWPSRSVSVLLGYPPGGVTDFGARGVVDRMSRELGQTLVVDNRPGAATAVANNAAAKAPPDGYTLLMGTSAAGAQPGGTHCLCQGQSGQGEFQLLRHWGGEPFVPGIIPGARWH